MKEPLPNGEYVTNAARCQASAIVRARFIMRLASAGAGDGTGLVDLPSRGPGKSKTTPGTFVVQLLLDGALVFHDGAQGEIAGIDGGRSSFVESRALRG
jgi:hypothetical protein